ncbi:DUF397 domain-containing protein [Streptomyces sp. ML-6]|uniref:DUF397 domain-containing protein n=1 Tax=Streptomyces sp. ML-6 TaxID=2982693 RepID=UPI0024BFA1C7|nr:DUF397 domain-containing protein [Streptomyces sp. ML-6]MDK0522408.1 DUF397 domain-containing protein [Streptomyces sp. ML-6]
MSEHDWQRSSFCSGGGNNCVEVAAAPQSSHIVLRESESPDIVLAASRGAMSALLLSVKARDAGQGHR